MALSRTVMAGSLLLLLAVASAQAERTDMGTAGPVAEAAPEIICHDADMNDVKELSIAEAFGDICVDFQVKNFGDGPFFVGASADSCRPKEDNTQEVELSQLKATLASAVSSFDVCNRGTAVCVHVSTKREDGSFRTVSRTFQLAECKQDAAINVALEWSAEAMVLQLPFALRKVRVVKPIELSAKPAGLAARWKDSIVFFLTQRNISGVEDARLEADDIILQEVEVQGNPLVALDERMRIRPVCGDWNIVALWNAAGDRPSDANPEDDYLHLPVKIDCMGMPDIPDMRPLEVIPMPFDGGRTAFVRFWEEGRFHVLKIRQTRAGFNVTSELRPRERKALAKLFLRYDSLDLAATDCEEQVEDMAKSMRGSFLKDECQVALQGEGDNSTGTAEREACGLDRCDVSLEAIREMKSSSRLPPAPCPEMGHDMDAVREQVCRQKVMAESLDNPQVRELVRSLREDLGVDREDRKDYDFGCGFKPVKKMQFFYRAAPAEGLVFVASMREFLQNNHAICRPIFTLDCDAACP